MEQLQRKVGPFKIWQWVIIVVLGVLLGIAVRGRFASAGSSEPVPATVPDFLPSQGAASGGSGGGSQIDMGIITAQLAKQNQALEAIASGDGLFKRISDLFIETTTKPDTTPVKTVGDPVVKVIDDTGWVKTGTITDPDLKIKDSIVASFNRVGLAPPGRDSARMKRLVSEVKAGRTYADIEFELRKYLYDQGKGSNPGTDPQNFVYGG